MIRIVVLFWARVILAKPVPSVMRKFLLSMRRSHLWLFQIFSNIYRQPRSFALLIPASLCLAQETNSIKQLFVQRCAVCHAAEAGGTDRGPALSGNRRLRARAVSDIANVIR